MSVKTNWLEAWKHTSLLAWAMLADDIGDQIRIQVMGAVNEHIQEKTYEN